VAGVAEMRTLHTARLVLEPQLAAHAEAMFDVLRDPAIYEYENEPPSSLAWLRERFRKLETRTSGDGREHWLNWVVRLTSGECIGYVQASVRGERAGIAYEFGSGYWGRGFASEAVQAMTGELVQAYGVRELTAVFKAANARSQRLLERQGFMPAAGDAEPDERCMRRSLSS